MRLFYTLYIFTMPFVYILPASTRFCQGDLDILHYLMITLRISQFGRMKVRAQILREVLVQVPAEIFCSFQSCVFRVYGVILVWHR